jgi:hypothetical protein
MTIEAEARAEAERQWTKHFESDGPRDARLVDLEAENAALRDAITETRVSIFGEKHAPFLYMGPLRHEDGRFPDAIIVATQDPGGFAPKALMLPHQLYTDTAAAILAESGQRNLWVLPIYDSSAWTQVEIPADTEKGDGDAER